MHGLMLWSNGEDRRPRLTHPAAPGRKAKSAADPARFPPRNRANPFARPPCVTGGQLLRISLLILASLVYSDPSPFLSGRLVGPLAQKFAARGVDHTPTSAIAPAQSQDPAGH